jgi:Geranylgeranyl pyrophosphate synthase
LGFGGKLAGYAELVNASLREETQLDNGVVSEAMRYSLLSGGKRTRACLTLAVCDMLGGDRRSALLAADAIEMLHCYSLIHDDLPCMDDDDYRRGQLSCHKKYGEATAMLAGDALLTLAFRTLSRIEDAEISRRCTALLSEAAGFNGMILGQELDLKGVDAGKEISAQLDRINENKTGKLITVSLLMGAVCSGISSGDIYDALERYGKGIGLVFQIVDDVLDVTSSLEELGKKTGSDEANSKLTYCSVYGAEGAMSRAEEITAGCIEALGGIGDSEFLEWYANDLLHRNK